MWSLLYRVPASLNAALAVYTKVGVKNLMLNFILVSDVSINDETDLL